MQTLEIEATAHQNIKNTSKVQNISRPIPMEVSWPCFQDGQVLETVQTNFIFTKHFSSLSSFKTCRMSLFNVYRTLMKLS